MPSPRPRLLAACLVAIGFAASALPASASPSPDIERPTVECAWWVETSIQNSNVLYPDTAAAYWTMPYLTSEAQIIELNGAYLDARYFAIQVYGADSQLFTSPQGQISALANYQIQPNAGEVNPWDAPAEPGGSWTVTLSDREVPGATNLLPLTPQGTVTPLIPEIPATTAFLMTRVYLPTDGFATAREFLPTVTITDRGGVVRTLEPCTPQQREALKKTKDVLAITKALRTRPAPPSADCGTSCPPDLTFFKVGSEATPFPNADSAYVGALYSPQRGRVVVARAAMPTTSTGATPEVWPGGKQLRYWSVCNYVHKAPFPAVETVSAGKKKDYACTNDTTTPLAGGEVATIVLSFPADKKAIQPRLKRMPNVTWMPMSPRYGKTQELLAIRNMLANPTFAQSATNIPTTGDPAAAQSTMGRYYPQVAMCSTKTFLTQGPAGCLRNG